MKFKTKFNCNLEFHTYFNILNELKFIDLKFFETRFHTYTYEQIHYEKNDFEIEHEKYLILFNNKIDYYNILKYFIYSPLNIGFVHYVKYIDIILVFYNN